MVTLSLKALTEKITEDILEQLSRQNPEQRLEINTQGQLVVMPPTGSLTSEKNSDLNYQIQSWNRQSKLGKVFDSSGGFKLSNGAIRSPDVSWVTLNKWNSLSREQQKKFAPIDPDFVIELMSPTDRPEELQQKMNEYISCGVKLGWLINPDERQVEIYRRDRDKKIINNPSSLSGEDILPGLTIDLIEIF
jgi:Uma2 family endonuclease